MPDIDHTDPANTAVKPGWKSSELWLTILSQVIGFILFSGFVHCDDAAPILKLGEVVVTQALLCKGAGAAMSILGLLGYQVQRGWIKTTANQAAAVVAANAGGAPANPLKPPAT